MMTEFNDRRWGSKDIETMFPGGKLIAATPWPIANRSKHRESYDKSLVTNRLVAGLHGPDELEEIDPRTLHATQSSITRAGVEHYLNSDQFEQHGETFADKENVGNRHPFVYHREDGQRLLLAGHHRAAASYLKGQPLEARQIEGPWGEKRKT